MGLCCLFVQRILVHACPLMPRVVASHGSFLHTNWRVACKAVIIGSDYAWTAVGESRAVFAGRGADGERGEARDCRARALPCVADSGGHVPAGFAPCFGVCADGDGV